jgi:CheY-like chemotaxis protein
MPAMSSPLVLIFYEKLMPGSQMVNRLQDMGYRVVSTTDPLKLVDEVRKQKPMVLVADLETKTGDVPDSIRELKEDLETQHIPVLAFANLEDEALHERARVAGAKLIAGRDGVLDQLSHLLDHVLEMD